MELIKKPLLILSVILVSISLNVPSKGSPPTPPFPEPVYNLIFFGSLAVFITNSYDRPSSFFQWMTLLASLISYITVPLVYAREYSCPTKSLTTTMAGSFGVKMLIWLRDCLESPKTVTPFWWGLVNWRTIKPSDKDQQRKLSTNSVSLEQRFISFMTVWATYVLCAQILEFFPPEVPNKPYVLRVIDFIRTGKPFISLHALLYCYIYGGALAVSMSFLYELILLHAAILFRVLCMKPKTPLHALLTPSQQVSLKEWLSSLLFDAKPLFNYPILSSGPIDFWKNRWHSVCTENFSNLGSMFARRFEKGTRIRKMMEVVGTFFVSAVIHEYYSVSVHGKSRGEHFSFILFHALVIIVWENVWGLWRNLGVAERKGRNTENEKKEREEGAAKKMLKQIAKILGWNLIVLLSAPWFFERYIRDEYYHCMAHFVCVKDTVASASTH
ncbi:7878_t:CDS:1 [Paraglomus occultum]|uniref:7878_t:CDS:1 n=1 Tax=Paraglomus occultum TaxID=144539 RepID=A0A9N8ZJD9_9GLOM|nr:7878_t:CDS:1 [Paraglomus occultum]